MYGWRLRIGLMVPSSNTTMESEFYQNLLYGVSIHTARMNIVNTTFDDLTKMTDDIEGCTHLLKTVAPDIIVYGCTTGSLLKGKGYDLQIEQRISEITGVPTVATASAVIEALKFKKLKNIAVVTPYTDDLNRKECEYLKEYGFKVSEIKGLNIIPNLDIGNCRPELSYRLGREIVKNNPNVDGLFISCTNFRTVEILESLQNDIGKPVISSNQASLWMTYRKTGLKTNCWGLES